MEVDPKIADVIEQDKERQQFKINLIAAENYVIMADAFIPI